MSARSRLRALAAIALVAGCVSSEPCHDGTVLLTLQLSGGAENADELGLALALDESTEWKPVQPLPHQPGARMDSVELVVPRYAAHHALRVQISPRQGQRPLGMAIEHRFDLSGACASVSFEVTLVGETPAEPGPDAAPDLSTDRPGGSGADADEDARVDAGDAPADAAADVGDAPLLVLADAGDAPAPSDMAADRAPPDVRPDLAPPDMDPCSGRGCSGSTADGCCLPGCNAANDTDCSGCGNGRLEGDERCDPLSSCPQSCPAMGCQRFQLVGAGTCLAHCEKSTLIDVCVAGDSCCPMNCDGTTDTDCKAVCGNNVVEPTEQCDPVSMCRAKESACVGDQEHVRVPMGNALDCTFFCMESPRPCKTGDGFCPVGCAYAQDNDCKKVDGASCGGAGECMSGSCVDSHCCKDTCSACQACTGAGGTCVPLPLNTDDNNPPGACSGNNTCDGNGICKLRDGYPCGTTNALCASGICADTVCCSTLCSGTCMSCNTPNNPGFCSRVANGLTDDTCKNGSHCNAVGACVPDMVCGDGVRSGTEGCDDGNLNPFDGCNGSCQVESGWTCPNPGSPCIRLPSDGGVDSPGVDSSFSD